MMEGQEEDIVNKGMEPKQESLLWTSTYAKEVEGPMVLEGAGRFWIIPFVKKLDLFLGHRYKRGGKCDAGMKKPHPKGLNSWKQHKLPLRTDIAADNMWKATAWVSEDAAAFGQERVCW